MVFIPMSAAKPNSRSIVTESYVSFCHISIGLMALAGMKFEPSSHGCIPYQSLIFSTYHLLFSGYFSPDPSDPGFIQEKRRQDRTRKKSTETGCALRCFIYKLSTVLFNKITPVQMIPRNNIKDIKPLRQITYIQPVTTEFYVDDGLSEIINHLDLRRRRIIRQVNI